MDRLGCIFIKLSDDGCRAPKFRDDVDKCAKANESFLAVPENRRLRVVDVERRGGVKLPSPASVVDPLLLCDDAD